jgi:hypothetical protein
MTGHQPLRFAENKADIAFAFKMAGMNQQGRNRCRTAKAKRALLFFRISPDPIAAVSVNRSALSQNDPAAVINFVPTDGIKNELLI